MLNIRDMNQGKLMEITQESIFKVKHQYLYVEAVLSDTFIWYFALF